MVRSTSSMCRVWMILLALCLGLNLIAGCGGGGGGGGGTVSGLGGGGGGGGGTEDEDLGEATIDGEVSGDFGDPGEEKAVLQNVDFSRVLVENAGEDEDGDGVPDIIDLGGTNWTSEGYGDGGLSVPLEVEFAVNGETLGACETDEDGKYICSLDLNRVPDGELVEVFLRRADDGELLHQFFLPVRGFADGDNYGFRIIGRNDGSFMASIYRVTGEGDPRDSTYIVVDNTSLDIDGDGLADIVNYMASPEPDGGALYLFDKNLDGNFGQAGKDSGLADLNEDGQVNENDPPYAFDGDGDGFFDLDGDLAQRSAVDSITALRLAPLLGTRVNEDEYIVDVPKGTEIYVRTFTRIDYFGHTPYLGGLQYKIDAGTGTTLFNQTTSTIPLDLGTGRTYSLGPVLIPGSVADQDIVVRVSAFQSDGVAVEDTVTLHINVQENVVPVITSVSAPSLQLEGAIVENEGGEPAIGAPGTVIEVLGSGFSSAASQNVVTINNIPAPVLTGNGAGTRLTAVVPSRAAGDAAEVVPVRVTVNGRGSNTFDVLLSPSGPFLTGTLPNLLGGGALTAPAASDLILRFNTGVDADDFADAITLTQVSGGALTPVFDTANAPEGLIRLRDFGPLTAGLTYTLHINANLTGLNGAEFDFIPGGAQDDFTVNFQAVAGDGNGPVLLAVSPADTATGVDPNSAIQLTFSEGVDPLSFIDGFSLLPATDAAYSFSNGFTVATVTPEAPLTGATEFTFDIDTGVVGDAEGNLAAIDGDLDAPFTFTTALRVASLTPISGTRGSEIQIRGDIFSSILDDNLVTFGGFPATTVSIEEPGAPGEDYVLTVEVPDTAPDGMVDVVVEVNGIQSLPQDFTVTTINAVVQQVATEDGPSSIAINPAGDRLMVTNQRAGSVSFYGLETGIPMLIGESIPTAPVMTEGLWVHETAYAINFGSPDAAGNTVIAFHTEDDDFHAENYITVGGRPTRIAADPEGQFLYVTNFLEKSVSIIDTETQSVTTTFGVGLGPDGVAVTPDGERIYICNFFADTVTIADASTNLPVGQINLRTTVDGRAGDGPARVNICSLPDLESGVVRHYAIVSEFNSGTLAKVDVATDTVIARLALGNGPAGVACDPTGQFIYVALREDDVVAVVSTRDFELVGTIAMPAGPSGITVTPDGGAMFVCCLDANVLAQIFLRDGTHHITRIVRPFADPGQIVRIEGEGFEEGATIFFNGAQSGDATWISETELDAVVPEDATTGPVIVAQDGVLSNPFNFRVTPLIPEVIAVEPNNTGVQVPVDPRVRVLFNEPVEIATVTTGSFRLYEFGGPQVGATGVLAGLVNPVDSNFAAGFELQLAGALQGNQKYEIRLINDGGANIILDSAGNELEQVSFTFWTIDTTDPEIVTATYRDLDGNGIDIGDAIDVLFDQDVRLQGPSTAAGALFELLGDGSDTFGAGATVTRDPAIGVNAPLTVRIVMGANPIFTVPGDAGENSLANAGFNGSLTPTALRYRGTGSGSSINRIVDVYGNAAPNLTTVDIVTDDATAPALESALFVDGDNDGTPEPGEQVQLRFNIPVYRVDSLGGNPFDFTDGTAGAATVAQSLTDARDWTLTLGAGTNGILPRGLYPATAGASGVYIITNAEFMAINGQIAGDNLAVDVGETTAPGPKLTAAEYVDNGGDGLTAGDDLIVTFDRAVQIDGTVDEDDFSANVADDSLGSLTAVEGPDQNQLTLTFTSAPSLTLAGLFAKTNRVTGAPSGIDIVAGGTDDITELFGTLSAVDLNNVGLDDNGVDITLQGGGIPTMIEAVYNDINNNSQIDRFDTIVTRFDRPLAPLPSAEVPVQLVMLNLIPDDRFGQGAVVTPGPDVDQLTIELGAFPRVRVAGEFGFVFDPGSPSGIDVIAGQTVIRGLGGQLAAPNSPAGVDVESGVVQTPELTRAFVIDTPVSGLGIGAGDHLVLEFSSAMDFHETVPGDFQLSGVATLGGGAIGTKIAPNVYRIVLGQGATLDVGETEVNVAPGVLQDLFGNVCDSTPVVIEGNPNDTQAPHLTECLFDDFDGSLTISAGDRLIVRFNEIVHLESSDVEDLFALLPPGPGYSFGDFPVVVNGETGNEFWIYLGDGADFVVAGVFSGAGSVPTGLGLPDGSLILDNSDNEANENVKVDIRPLVEDTEPPYMVGAFGLPGWLPDNHFPGSMRAGDLLICQFNEGVVVGPNASRKSFSLPVQNDFLGARYIDEEFFSTNIALSTLATPNTYSSPSAAYDVFRQRYLTVWLETGGGAFRVRGRFVGNNGLPLTAPGSDLNIYNSAIAKTRLRLYYAPFADKYLAAWLEGSTLRVQLLDPATGGTFGGLQSITGTQFGGDWRGVYNAARSVGFGEDIFVFTAGDVTGDQRLSEFTVHNNGSTAENLFVLDGAGLRPQVTGVISSLAADAAGNVGMLWDFSGNTRLTIVFGSFDELADDSTGISGGADAALAFSAPQGIWVMGYRVGTTLTVLPLQEQGGSIVSGAATPTAITPTTLAEFSMMTEVATGTVMLFAAATNGADTGIALVYARPYFDGGGPAVFVSGVNKVANGSDAFSQSEIQLTYNAVRNLAFAVWMDERADAGGHVNSAWGQQVGVPAVVFQSLPTFGLGPQQVGVFLGSGATLRPDGVFNPANTAPGASSGIDVAANMPLGEIFDINGNPAVKRSVALGSTASPVDIASEDQFPPFLLGVEFVLDASALDEGYDPGQNALILHFSEPVEIGDETDPDNFFDLDNLDNLPVSFGSSPDMELLLPDGGFSQDVIILLNNANHTIVAGGFYGFDGAATGVRYNPTGTIERIRDNNDVEFPEMPSFFDIFFNPFGQSLNVTDSAPNYSSSFDVPVDLPFFVEFDAELDPSSVSIDSVRLERQGEFVNLLSAVDLSLTAGNTRIDIDHDDLDSGEGYLLIVTMGVRSLNGLTLPFDYVVPFQTDSLQMVFSSPGFFENNVPVDVAPFVEFDADLDPLVVNPADTGDVFELIDAVTQEPVPGVTVMVDGGEPFRMLVDVPGSLLPGHPYRLWIKSAVRSIDGLNLLDDVFVDFETVAADGIASLHVKADSAAGGPNPEDVINIATTMAPELPVVIMDLPGTAQIGNDVRVELLKPDFPTPILLATGHAVYTGGPLAGFELPLAWQPGYPSALQPAEFGLILEARIFEDDSLPGLQLGPTAMNFNVLYDRRAITGNVFNPASPVSVPVDVVVQASFVSAGDFLPMLADESFVSLFDGIGDFGVDGTVALQRQSDSSYVTGDLQLIPGGPGGSVQGFTLDPGVDLEPGENYVLKLHPDILSFDAENFLDAMPITPGLQQFEYPFSTAGTPANPIILQYMTPTYGAPDDVIVICGENLTDTQRVEFAGFGEAVFEAINDNLLIVTIPSGLPDGMYPLNVFDQAVGGTAALISFTNEGSFLCSAPTAYLDKPELCMAKEIHPPFDDNGFSENRNAEPADVLAANRFFAGGASALFVTTANNLLRYSVNPASGELETIATSKISFDQTPYFFDDRPFVVAIHPDRSLARAYVSITDTGNAAPGFAMVDDIDSLVSMTPAGFFAVETGESTAQAHDIAVAPCGNVLAVVSRDGEIGDELYYVVLDAAGDPAGPAVQIGLDLGLNDNVDEITRLEFSPDGRFLYICYWVYDSGEGFTYGKIDRWDVFAQPAVATRVWNANNDYSMTPSGVDDFIIAPSFTYGYIADCNLRRVIRVSISPSDGSLSPTEDYSLLLPDPCMTALAADWNNGLVFATTEEASVVLTLEDSSGMLMLSDRFVPGALCQAPALLRTFNGSMETPYQLVTAAEAGFGGGALAAPGDDGYLCPMRVAFGGTWLREGDRLYDDTGVPADTLRVTVYDATTGCVIPGAIGWINNPASGSLVVGYAEGSPNNYFTLPNGEIDLLLDASGASFNSHLTPPNTRKFSLTVAKPAFVPGQPGGYLPKTYQNIDLSSAPSNHLAIGIFPQGVPNDGESFVQGYVDGSGASGGIDFTSPTVRTVMGTDFDEEPEIVPVDPVFFNYFVEVPANRPNLMTVTVTDHNGVLSGEAPAFLGWGRHQLPRIWRGVTWSFSGSGEYGPNFILIDESDPGLTLEDYAASPQEVFAPSLFPANGFTAGSRLTVSAGLRNTDGDYLAPPRHGLLGSPSTAAGTVPFDDIVASNFVEMKLPHLTVDTAFEYLALILDQSSDVFSATRLSGLSPIGGAAVPEAKIINPVILSVPVSGVHNSFLDPVAQFAVTGENPFARPMPDREYINGAATMTKGLLVYELEGAEFEWDLVRGMDIATPGAFTWPQVPALLQPDFDFRQRQGDLFHLSVETLGLDATVVQISGDGLEQGSEREIMNDFVHRAMGPAAVFAFNTYNPVLHGTFRGFGGSAPEPTAFSAAKQAFVPDTGNPRRILIAGGEDTVGGSVFQNQSLTWFGGTLAFSGVTAAGGPDDHRLTPLLFQGDLTTAGSPPFPQANDDAWSIVGGFNQSQAPLPGWLADIDGAPVEVNPDGGSSRDDLHVSRLNAQVVDFYWEFLNGSNANEHPHMHLVLGGNDGGGGLIPNSAPLDYCFEVWRSAHFAADGFGGFMDNAAGPVGNKTIYGAGSNLFIPRSHFQAILLADYAERNDLGGLFGKAWILVMGGYVDHDADPLTPNQPTDSVQLVMVDYSEYLKSAGNDSVTITVQDLPPLQRPRAEFAAAPLFYVWNVGVNRDQFMEHNLSVGTGPGKKIFLAGGITGFGEGDDTCEIYEFTYNAGVFGGNNGAGNNERFGKLQTGRFGGTAIPIGGSYAAGPATVYLLGGASEGFRQFNGFGPTVHNLVTAIEKALFVPLQPPATKVVNFLDAGRFGHTATKYYVDAGATQETEILIVGGRNGNGQILTADVAEIYAPSPGNE